jgi:hypothetical protein
MYHEPITHPVYNQSYKRWYAIQRQTGSSPEKAAQVAHRYACDIAQRHQEHGPVRDTDRRYER